METLQVEVADKTVLLTEDTTYQVIKDAILTHKQTTHTEQLLLSTHYQDTKPWTIVHGFWSKTENFDFGQKGYHMKEHLKESIMVQISAS